MGHQWTNLQMPKTLEKTKKNKKNKFWKPNGASIHILPHWAPKICFFGFFCFLEAFWAWELLGIPRISKFPRAV